MKTIKNQKLFFISLAGIVVVSLMLITTYAYQTLQVSYATGSKKDMTASSGVLDVSFEISNVLNLINMPLLPDYKTSDYIEFSLNNKSSSDVAYNITLKNLEYVSSLSSEDFKYSIVDVTNGEKLLTTGDFRNLNSDTYSLSFATGKFDFMKQGEQKRIRIYLWLQSTAEDQSKFEGNSFKGQVEVTSIFSSDITDSALTYNIFNDNSLNSDNFINIPDNSGMSYLYKSDATNNYIDINNMCFRIVRIEGDGSIKLVLENKDSICENSASPSPFINKDVDYNVSLNNWYNETLKDLNSIKEEIWCNDSLVKYDINTRAIITDEQVSDFLYETGMNVLESDNYISTLKCNNYTKNKVGLLDINEILSIGINKNNNISSYLTDNVSGPFITSAKYGNINGVLNYIVIDNGILTKNNIDNSNVRPSIVLKGDTTINSGDGTKGNPYKIG